MLPGEEQGDAEARPDVVLVGPTGAGEHELAAHDREGEDEAGLGREVGRARPRTCALSIEGHRQRDVEGAQQERVLGIERLVIKRDLEEEGGGRGHDHRDQVEDLPVARGER